MPIMQRKTNHQYQILVKGELDARWHTWFDDLTLTVTEDGNTLLSGVIVDQAALHGVLNKIKNLGLELISVSPHQKELVMSKETSSQTDGMPIKGSFAQKSAGVSLFIVASTAAYYFAKAWPMRPIALAGTAIPDGFGGLVLTTIGIIIVMQIVLQIVLIIGAGGDTKESPKDQLASLKASRNAFGVMAAGAMVVVGLLFVEFPAFCLANMAVMSLLVAEIVKFASQLVYASRGN